MQTYNYVDTAGKMQTVQALDSASAIKNAPGIASNSGVMLVSGQQQMSPATAQINSGQQQNFETASNKDAPTTRSSAQSYDDIFKSLQTSLQSNLPQRPEQVSLTKTFTDLRSSQGITDLETSLNQAQAQARDIQAISRQRTNAERGKAVPMNVIAGRVSEVEQQENERLSFVNDSIKTISAQLDTKYKMIDSIMQYTGTDYANAVDNYDRQFSQNMSMLTMARGIMQDEQTKQERIEDNARANLQIVYNNLSQNNVDPANIDPAQKANITRMELQAGLPVGFYSNVVNKNPTSEILSTTTRETAGGQKYSDIILRDKDGKISTQSVLLGSVRLPSSGGGDSKLTEAEQKRADANIVSKQLQSVAGGDGYISPEDYKTARKAWISAGYNSKDFDDRFKDYANPQHLTEYGVKLDW